VHVARIETSGSTFRFSRVSDIEDSYAGKTRENNQNLRWGGAVSNIGYK
jgi:hypothetical protein